MSNAAAVVAGGAVDVLPESVADVVVVLSILVAVVSPDDGG